MGMQEMRKYSISIRGQQDLNILKLAKPWKGDWMMINVGL